MATDRSSKMPSVITPATTAESVSMSNCPAHSPGTCTATSSLEDRMRLLSTADITVDKDDGHLSRNTTRASEYCEETAEIGKLDAELVEELKDEDIPTTTDATVIRTTPDPYRGWECGFGFMGKLEAPSAIPNTKTEFLQAVKGEVNNISCIQNGLNSYVKAINSGVHHAFDQSFLKNQTDAAHKTIGQLFHISSNLEDVVKEVEAIEGDSANVKTELKEALAHAQPWIMRTRAILVSAHVFYKINYVLASDKANHTH